ncbi:MAG: hypothetical protein QOF68_3043 [Gaiellales bacterium]|jgi:hypothetical protein|nr:hypothetical protein [Gaiellales bacterium]
MKGRVTLLTLLITLAGAAVSQGASLSAHTLCGSSCGTLSALNGAGNLSQTGTGITYGSVRAGTIAILDRSANGTRNYSVSGWSRTWRKYGFVYFKGRNMSYFVDTTWTVRITGTGGIVANTVARGSGYIKGAGVWSVNRTAQKRWPSTGRSFQLHS